MTITIERDALLAALHHAAGAVSSRNTIPVLANILIEAEGADFRVTGSDLDIYVTQRTDMEPAESRLATTVSAVKLVGAVQSLKPGKIKIERGAAGAVTLRQSRSVRTMAVIPATDYPKPDEEAVRCSFSLPAPALLRMLGVPSLAVSTDETRYYLNGVFLQVEAGRLYAAATDGIRLIRADMAVPDGADRLPDGGVIIPSKTIKLLVKALAKGDGVVQISVGDRRARFEFGDSVVVSKFVEGTYPAYQRVIPADGSHVIRIARDALIEPVSAVQAIIEAEGKDRSRAVAIVLGSTDADHEVTSRDTSGALASEPLDAEVEGGAFSIAFAGQLFAGLAGIFAESGKLTVRVSDAGAAAKITSDKDPDLVAVMMPRRI